MTTKLLDNTTGADVSAPFLLNGKMVSLVTLGTPGSLVVQVSPDNGTTWIDSDVTMNAAGVKNFVGGHGLLARLSVSGASALTAWVAYGE
jgi:hypothetical protein